MNNFNEWIDEVATKLHATPHFDYKPTLYKKAWKPLFDDGYTPSQAIQIDFGNKANPTMSEGRLPISIYWESFA